MESEKKNKISDKLKSFFEHRFKKEFKKDFEFDLRQIFINWREFITFVKNTENSDIFVTLTTLNFETKSSKNLKGSKNSNSAKTQAKQKKINEKTNEKLIRLKIFAPINRTFAKLSEEQKNEMRTISVCSDVNITFFEIICGTELKNEYIMKFLHLLKILTATELIKIEQEVAANMSDADKSMMASRTKQIDDYLESAGLKFEDKTDPVNVLISQLRSGMMNHSGFSDGANNPAKMLEVIKSVSENPKIKKTGLNIDKKVLAEKTKLLLNNAAKPMIDDTSLDPSTRKTMSGLFSVANDILDMHDQNVMDDETNQLLNQFPNSEKN